jgi:hypothetical protein
MSRQELKQHTLFTLRFVTAIASIAIAFSVIKILHQNQIQIAQQKQLLSHQSQLLTQAHKATEVALARIHDTESEQIKIISCQFALLGSSRSAVITRAQFNACIKDTTFAPPLARSQHTNGSNTTASGAVNNTTSTSPGQTNRKSSGLIAVVPSRQTTNPPAKNPTPTAPPEPPSNSPQPPTQNPQPAAPRSAIQLTIGQLLNIKLL